MNGLDFRFKCPECGGSSFGSTIIGTNPDGPMHRRCKGNRSGRDAEGRDGCTFEWGEHEDWKYFHHKGQFLSQADYNAVMEKLRNTPFEAHPTPGLPCTLPGTSDA